jgi:hypothetical protein
LQQTGAGITAFRGLKSLKPAPLLNFVVRPLLITGAVMHPEPDDVLAKKKPTTESLPTGRLLPKTGRAIPRIGRPFIIAGVLVLLSLATTDLHIHVGLGRGSKRYANEWKAVFQELPDPEAAQGVHKEAASKRFGDGRWVFGVCKDSHSSIWGGTSVIKDSTGSIRAFFGHVCGSQFLDRVFQEADSLDGFYSSEQLKRHGFAEYEFP